MLCRQISVSSSCNTLYQHAPRHVTRFPLCPERRASLCRWASEKKDDAAEASTSSSKTSSSSTSRDPMTSRRLINQLLQIQSLQSVDIPAADEQELLSAQQAPAAEPQAASSSRETPTLFDDPAAEDYDPLVLDMLGFTSVSQYLDSKLVSAAGEAKVCLVGVALWTSLAATIMMPLGGPEAYSDSLTIFTDGGLQMNNLGFLWVGILTYYSIKGAVMSLVTGLRSWRLHGAQGERPEELAALVQAQDQRRAFWQLQEKLQQAHDKANRTYAEFALSTLLLAVLLLMNDGPDHLELQVETLDQDAFRRLLVIVWLFWETYFSTMGAVLKVSQLASAAINKWTYTRKWGSIGTRNKH